MEKLFPVLCGKLENVRYKVRINSEDKSTGPKEWLHGKAPNSSSFLGDILTTGWHSRAGPLREMGLSPSVKTLTHHFSVENGVHETHRSSDPISPTVDKEDIRRDKGLRVGVKRCLEALQKVRRALT